MNRVNQLNIEATSQNLAEKVERKMEKKVAGKSARMLEFDLLKCLAIFLVLCGHSIMHLSSESASQNDLFFFISSFHMPLFMMIAGFFSWKTLQLPLKDIFNKKFMQLIYPTITFGIIYFLINVIVYSDEIKTFPSHMFTVFWFLKSCFLCYIVTYACLKISRNKLLVGAIIAIIISQLLPVYKLAWMVPFFVIGLLVSQNYKFITAHSLTLFIISLICFSGFFIVFKRMPEVDLVTIKNELLGGNFDSVKIYLLFQMSRIVIGSLGCCMFLSLFILLSEKFGKYFNNSLFLVYGQQTLGIYILQTLLLETILSRLIENTSLSVGIFSYLMCPLLSLVIMDLCSSMMTLINKKKRVNKLLMGV